jgi:hypothetical protein
VDAGGAVVEILGTYSFARTPTPTKAQLDSWITTYNLTCSTFIDAPGHAGQTIDFFTIRETLLIVAIPSMQIKYVLHGDVSGISASSVSQATSVILGYLSQP